MAGAAGVGRGWRDRAVCRAEDPELFFPVGRTGPAVEQVARAKAVCVRCPVVAECLSFALVAIPEGVAGGLTAEERQGLRARRPGGSRVPTAGVAGRLPGGVGGLPAGVDELVVAQLVAGVRVSGASRQELAHAAVGLYQAGRRCGWIGTRLGVADRQVARWLERHRAGKPLIGVDGRPGRVSA